MTADGAVWTLRVEAGPRAGDEISLAGGANVLGGRGGGPEATNLDDGAVADRHAVLQATPQLEIRDLGSGRPTVVNGQVIGSAAVRLQAGDRIDLGQTRLVVQPLRIVIDPIGESVSPTVLAVDVDTADLVVRLEPDSGHEDRRAPVRVPLSVRVRVASDAIHRDVVLDIADRELPVGDVVAALGERVHDTVWVDGQSVPANTPAIDAGMADGSILSVEAPIELRTPDLSPLDLVVVAGAAAGRVHPLRRGLSTLGQASSNDIVVAAPGVAREHLHLEVGADGVVHYVNRAPSAITRIDGEPVGDEGILDPGRLLRVGLAGFTVRDRDRGDRPAAVHDRARISGPIPFNRPPRPALPPKASTSPTPRTPAFNRSASSLNIVAIVAPLVLGAVLVIVLDSLLFALFMLLSPVMAIGGWFQSRHNMKKARRTHEVTTAEDLTSFRAALTRERAVAVGRLRLILPDTAEVRRRADGPSDRLWERRPGHDDFLLVSAGVGDAPWEAPIEGRVADLDDDVRQVITDLSVLADVPVAVSLDEGGVIGIVGEREWALGLARGIVCQVAVHHGPADVPVAVLASSSAVYDWDWSKWLPHVDVLGAARTLIGDTDASEKVLDGLLPEQAREHRGPMELPGGATPLVVIDDEELFDGRRSRARRLLRGEGINVGAVVIARTADRLPASCNTVIQVTGPGTGVVEHPQRGIRIGEVSLAHLDAEPSETTARRLARFEDPDVAREGASIPERVTLWSLLGIGALDPNAIGARWTTAPDGLWIPMGADDEGALGFDLATEGPHALVGGTTGSGKSELLRSMLAGMALSYSPDELTFLLLDFKGGGALEVFASYPHCVGLVTSLDIHLAERALQCIRSELRRREEILQPFGGDIVVHQGTRPAEPLPRLVIVADEFAEMKTALPDFVDSLVSVAAKGRSLGVHLVLATQRPSGAISPNIRENTNLRIALRTMTTAESNDVIDDPAAAAIPHQVKGRAYLKVGNAPAVPFQTAISGVEVSEESAADVQSRPFRFESRADGPVTGRAVLTDEGSLAVLREVAGAVTSAFEASGRPRPRSVAPDPLPETIALEGLVAHQGTTITFALGDDPAAQAQYPVGWDMGDGHLLLYGIRESDTTNGLLAIALALAKTFGPDELNLYVLDFGAGATQPLRLLPHLGAWISGDERERQIRLVRFLRDEVESRQRDPSRRAGPKLVVLLDGFGAFLRDYRDVAGQETLRTFERVFAEAAEVGILFVGTANHPTAVPRTQLGQVPQRIVFRLTDPHEFSGFNVPSRMVPDMPPDRAFLSDRRQLIQVARVLDDLDRLVQDQAATSGPSRNRPAAIECLPARVAHNELPQPVTEDRPWRLPVGLAEADLAPVDLVVFEGEHIFVGGPARSGKTSTLALIGHQAAVGSDVHRIGVASRRSPLSTMLALDLILDPGEIDAIVEHLDPERRTIVLIDDLEMTERSEKVMVPLIANSPPGLMIVASGRSDGMRGNYGHWGASLRRSNLGVLLRPDLNSDGDLLGTSLPRRLPVDLLPGRGFVVNGGEATLAQLSLPPTS